MTVKELSQLYYLNREIEMDKARLEKLRARISGLTSPNLSGMPRGSGNGNGIENCIAEIVDLEAIISAKVTQCMHERNRLERYIAGIPDSLTRQIFALRFINGLSWLQVAFSVGGNCTADSARMTCNRYIHKNNQQEK